MRKATTIAPTMAVALSAGAASADLERGTFADRIYGQDGRDALYGGRGDDEIDARDGEKDAIVIRFGEGDVVSRHRRGKT